MHTGELGHSPECGWRLALDKGSGRRRVLGSDRAVPGPGKAFLKGRKNSVSWHLSFAVGGSWRVPAFVTHLVGVRGADPGVPGPWSSVVAVLADGVGVPALADSLRPLLCGPRAPGPALSGGLLQA